MPRFNSLLVHGSLLDGYPVVRILWLFRQSSLTELALMSAANYPDPSLPRPSQRCVLQLQSGELSPSQLSLEICDLASADPSDLQ